MKISSPSLSRIPGATLTPKTVPVPQRDQDAQMRLMAEAIAKSGLFGMKTKDQALALMIVAQAENRHPGSVAAEYHIIQNRPAFGVCKAAGGSLVYC